MKRILYYFTAISVIFGVLCSCHSPKLEFDRYMKAAKHGSAKAMNSVGDCYYNGYGVKQDYKEAFKWYENAAELRYAPAQYNLGMCYKNGRGVKTNISEAYDWWKLSADQGNADAQYELYIYWSIIANNDFFQSNYREAASRFRLEYLNKAAAQGHKEAQKTLKMLGQ